MITASEGRGASASGGKVIGLNPLTGKVMWEYANWQCGIPIPNVVEAGDNKFLVSGGYQAGSAMIKVDKKADGSYGVTELYKNADFGTHTQPPILYNGNFYVQFTNNERKDGMVCMSMDGQIKWKTGRAPLFDKGGMILADGLILSTDGSKKLYLIQPDPAAFKPVSSVELMKEGQNWAPLALVDGKLLIRDQSRLMCVKVIK
jgi:hypothetical protein